MESEKNLTVKNTKNRKGVFAKKNFTKEFATGVKIQ